MGIQGQRRRLERLSSVDVKEAYRLFWLVKGHLNTTHECILDSYDSYFKRVWYNEESYIHEDGFEEAWQKIKLKLKEQ